MLPRSPFPLLVLVVLSVTGNTVARYKWLEREDHFIALYPRRFGQEHPAVIDKLSNACPSDVCGNLSGQAITPLLAAQGECTQQDMADTIIGELKHWNSLCLKPLTSRLSLSQDAAQQFDATTKASLIAIAQEYRQVEKNTPPVCSMPLRDLRCSH